MVQVNCDSVLLISLHLLRFLGGFNYSWSSTGNVSTENQRAGRTYNKMLHWKALKICNIFCLILLIVIYVLYFHYYNHFAIKRNYVLNLALFFTNIGEIIILVVLLSYISMNEDTLLLIASQMTPVAITLSFSRSEVFTKVFSAILLLIFATFSLSLIPLSIFWYTKSNSLEILMNLLIISLLTMIEFAVSCLYWSATVFVMFSYVEAINEVENILKNYEDATPSKSYKNISRKMMTVRRDGEASSKKVILPLSKSFIKNNSKAVVGIHTSADDLSLDRNFEAFCDDSVQYVLRNIYISILKTYDFRDNLRRYSGTLIASLFVWITVGVILNLFMVTYYNQGDIFASLSVNIFFVIASLSYMIFILMTPLKISANVN